MIIIKYYTLYTIVCALFLYDWQRRFVYISITTNMYVLCYVTLAMILLGKRNFSAPLCYGTIIAYTDRCWLKHHYVAHDHSSLNC